MTNLKTLPRGAKSQLAKVTGLSVMTIIAYFNGKKVSQNSEIKILEALNDLLTAQKERKEALQQNIKNLLEC